MMLPCWFHKQPILPLLHLVLTQDFSYSIAISLTLVALCLLTYSNAPRAGTQHSTRFTDRASNSSSWGDWSWIGTKKDSSWRFNYQSEKEKDKKLDADRWIDQPRGKASASFRSVATPALTIPGWTNPDTTKSGAGRSDDDYEPPWLDDLRKLTKGARVRIDMDFPGSDEVGYGNDWGNAISPDKTTVTVTSTFTAFETMTAAAALGIDDPPLLDLATSFDVDPDIKFLARGPERSQVVFLTATDGGGNNGEIADIVKLVQENRKMYCAHHGYNYHFVNTSDFSLGSNVHAVWKKIPAIIDAFHSYPEAQWVFFLDLDAIIMSPEQDLNSLVLSHAGMLKSLDLGADFIDSRGGAKTGHTMANEPDFDNLDLLIGQDHNGLNAGSFFLRRTQWTKWMLDFLADPVFLNMDWDGREQETLMHFFRHHVTFRSHVGLLKMRTHNAYPIGGDRYGWNKGDLVVHLAGCWVEHHCQELWDKYWGMRGIIGEHRYN